MHGESYPQRPAMNAQRWTGVRMLEAVYGLNAKCFARLAQVAQDSTAMRSYGCVFASPDLWARVDERACQRAGSCPVLLLDLKFQDDNWWAVASGRSKDPLGERSSDDDDKALTQGHFAAVLGEVLMEAWSIARSVPQALRFPFGMAPKVASLIAGLSASDLQGIITQHAAGGVPRWAQNRIFWDRLLSASISCNDELLNETRLYSIQLLGREFLKIHH